MSKFKNLNSNKAITLIALIITIIVMLVLVAVTVSILVESDLIGSAEKAGDAYKNAQDKEGSMGQVTIGGVKYDSIEDYLNDNPSTGIKINLSLTNHEEAVTVGGNVSAIVEGAPIPTGFYYVGGTLNTGVVISDDEDDLNEGDGHDVTLEGNQYVWVPVLQNQKIKIQVTSEENEITDIKLEDPKNSEIELTEPNGKTYEAEVNPTINGTYTLTVTVGEKTVSEKIKISSLYAQDFFVTLEVVEAELESVAAQYGMTVLQVLEASGFSSIDEYYNLVITQLSSHTDATIATYAGNVNKYGGFYIARYEAGSDVPRTSSSASLTTVYSKKNMYPYNYVTQIQARELSQGIDTGKTSVTSDLVNAAAWDRTLNWLIETKAVTEEQVAINSTSWGNYLNSSFNFTGKYSTDDGDNFTDTTSSTPKPENDYYLLGTGVSSYTRKNNIYDLAGNCGEWSTEAYSSGNVAKRGGDYDDDGEDGSARVRDEYGASDSDRRIAFRPVLYINQ